MVCAIIFLQTIQPTFDVGCTLYYLSRLMGKPTICLGENKGADQLRGYLISAFVFATRIVRFLFYLNPKFQASSSFLCLYRPVCVRPVRKPHCCFSHKAARKISNNQKPSQAKVMSRPKHQGRLPKYYKSVRDIKTKKTIKKMHVVFGTALFPITVYNRNKVIFRSNLE